MAPDKLLAGPDDFGDTGIFLAANEPLAGASRSVQRAKNDSDVVYGVTKTVEVRLLCNKHK